MLVARAEVPAGTVLDEPTIAGAFTVTRLSGGAPLGGLPADPAQLVGHRTAAALSPGEPLTLAALGGGRPAVAPLAPGERAVAVPAQAAGAAATALEPGMRVDVVASSGEGPAGRTRVIVTGAEVLAVDPGGDGGFGQAPAAGAVLLRAGARDALLITAALNFSREVRLLARPDDEVAGAPVPEVAVP
ncbi:MAG: RcpC/CpaB family pilus assembly protein [Thermoleophilia bacterium]